MPLLVTSEFPPTHGGIQRYTARLAAELSARSQAVAVVAPMAPGYERFDQHQPFATVRYRPTGRRLDLVKMFAAAVRAARLKKRDYTIAASWYPSGLVAALLPRRLRGPLAIVAHGAELTPRGPWRARLMRYVFDCADVILADSAYSRKLLAQAGIGRDAVVTHAGVDLRPPQGTPRSDDPCLLSVGRLVRRKGFDRVITALPALLQEFPRLRYEIVGDGPERRNLSALARKLGVEQRIVFHGNVDDRALQRAYERAWCFALPVRDEGGSVEAFGIVYLEAAAAGLAAVGGRNSGAEDAIVDGETGLLVDGDDVGEITAALRKLLADPRAAFEMGERGRARALEEFTWPRIADRICGAMAPLAPLAPFAPSAGDGRTVSAITGETQGQRTRDTGRR